MSIDYSKKSFLVIDDFEKFRTVLKGIIQLCGGKSIEIANSGSEAISRIKHNSFDVILCDYHLGSGKNGQQILEQIKYENLLAQTSVFLMVTAESGSEMVMGAIECQPDGYLMKPFNQAMLKARLNKIMKLKSFLAPIYKEISLGNKKEAIKLCQEISLEHPKYVSNIKRIEADLYVDCQEFEQAKQIYDKVLSIRPLPWAGLGLGQVNYHLGNYDEAIEIFEELIDSNKLLLPAYDWLAKTYIKLDSHDEAEQILKQAIDLSPKAILRQMDLGNLAIKNGDLDIAQHSFREAIKLGRNSCFKSPDNYTSLAKTLIPKLKSDNEAEKKLAAEETFSVLKEVKNDYKSDKKVSLEATLLEAESYSELKDNKNASLKLESANSIYANFSTHLPVSIKISMAKTLSKMGKQAQAESIAEEVAAECGEEQGELLHELGQLVENSQLNSEGIALYRKGQYKKAVHVFNQACAEYPGSISINLNAIQALIKLIERVGDEDELISKCEEYFSAIHTINAEDKRYNRYLELKKLYKSVIGGKKREL